MIHKAKIYPLIKCMNSLVLMDWICRMKSNLAMDPMIDWNREQDLQLCFIKIRLGKWMQWHVPEIKNKGIRLMPSKYWWWVKTRKKALKSWKYVCIVNLIFLLVFWVKMNPAWPKSINLNKYLKFKLKDKEHPHLLNKKIRN